MKKKKVFYVSVLSVLLCFPLLGFKYSNNGVTSSTSSSDIEVSSTSTTSLESSTVVSTETTFSSSDVNDKSTINQTNDEETENQIKQEAPIAEKFYVSIIDKNYQLLEEPNGEVLQDNGENYQRTFAAQEIDDNGTKLYLLFSPEKQVGYIQPNSTEQVIGQEGKLFSETDVYGSINSADVTLFNSNFQANGTTSALKDHTYKIDGFYNHFDGKQYYLLKDVTDKFVGIVESIAVEKTKDQAGQKHSVNDYYSVVKNNQKVWKNFDFEELGTSELFVDQTFNVKEWYYHFNGTKYFVLYDNSANFKGIVEEGTIQRASSPGGIWKTASQYVTITKNNWTIWKDFNFKNGSSTNNLYQRTYRVTGWYRHINGTKYLSVYDNKGIWQGYLNEDGAQVVDTPGGQWHSTNQYVTVTKNNWTIWKDFNFKNGSSTKNMYQKTYRVTGWYRHYNGSKYLSVYDNKGNWQGYLNEGGAQVVNNPGGQWHSTNQYVTITKNNWTIWKDFNFKNGSSTKNMYQKTYRVTGWYRHYNGSKYLSVYNNNGNWQGYLNEGGAAKAAGAQGTGFSINKSVLVIKSGYSIWNNFGWKEKARTNSLINKTYQIKWYYKHMNGSTYYSLYDSSNGNWFGYVNSGAVRERRGTAHYLGTSRQRVMNELYAHQNDRFYLSTPYRGLSSSNPEPFLSPYGAPNAYGPGMNCTGFVAYVMRRSGGNLNRISGITQGWGSYANAYNWRDALMRNTEYYTFNSIDALLKSGKAQKGDIIYFDPVWTDINYDCHIGIFWGNRSNENRIWHQVLAGNMQSHIFSGTRFSKIYLFPQD
ncbi:hypothetical protein [Enterococcus dongliensis]|uniref:NlpC/P60 domain-containing protein n=1 Tax=Enterococcus dongliensis TaxID=2559925 RepID=A0AAW8TMP2_9ENTE|nr:hypothetical protein [Enterococcus dongliensis]MDT2638325.1 hypothetical protein [Enterococcus dongliensis]